MILTTPIYYVNGDPHLGHAHTTVMADILKRGPRYGGNGAFLTTGVDEYGQKNAECAKAAGLPIQRFLDQQAEKFKALFDRLGIRYDYFVRTTDQQHVSAVTRALNNLKDQFVKKDYTGLYCVGCEQFKKDSDLNAAGECPDHLKKPVSRTETNWFLPLEPYRERLIEYIELNPDWIRPRQYAAEVRNLLSLPLEDLCISRPKDRLQHGIEIPFDRDYVTYVWFDALMNYLSSQFFPHNHTVSWPATEHLIGKDIVKTHCVYWPIMLMALGEEMPKGIQVHAHWLGKGKIKMAKSLGNVVDPNVVADNLGVDALRYFLARRGSVTQDTEITEELIEDLYNLELAGGLGNLMSRAGKLYAKEFGGFKDSGSRDSILTDLKTTLNVRLTWLGDIPIYVEAAKQGIDQVNAWFSDQAPWSMIKAGKRDEAEHVLRMTLLAVVQLFDHLWPVIPEGVERGLGLLGVEGREIADGHVFDIGTGLFTRK